MKIKRFIYGICHANSYLLYDEETKKAVMFDSCGANEKILTFLNDNEITLCGIFLTHGHFDHIDRVKELKNCTGAKVYIYYDEEKFLTNREFNLSDDDNFNNNSLEKADVLFKDNDVISVCGIKIKVIYTPGHTSGSVCFLTDAGLFSGDTLFRGSVGRFDFPTGDGYVEIASIKEKLLVLNDDIKVYPGHGFSTTIGRERKENLYLYG